jgi:predicted ATPase
VELLERGPALAALHSALDATLGGAGRVAAVSGEAGIGKTSLVEAFRAAASGRARVLTGACDDLLAPRALGPLHDVAHRLGDAPALLDAAAQGRYGAVTEALRAAPTVLVVEDVHWGDEATLDWLAHLGRRLAELPVLLVLTFREDDPESTTSIARVLATLPRRHVVRLPLAALSPDAVAVLAGPRSAEVYALTGGSPLLVTELLAGGGAEVPPSIRESVLVGRRTAGDPAPRRGRGQARRGRPRPPGGRRTARRRARTRRAAPRA